MLLDSLQDGLLQRFCFLNNGIGTLQKGLGRRLVREAGGVDARAEQEAEKLGFTTCVVPKAGLKSLKNIKGIRIIGVENVKEAINTMKNALNEEQDIV